MAAVRSSLALAALLAGLAAHAAEPIVGRGSVIDGDTLEVQGRRIRLSAIDAPESGQTCKDRDGATYRCGQRAALALADRIGSAPISCEPVDTDRYGRTVAVCRHRGEDLGGWMVENGHALAYLQYGGTIRGEGRCCPRGPTQSVGRLVHAAVGMATAGGLKGNDTRFAGVRSRCHHHRHRRGRVRAGAPPRSPLQEQVLHLPELDSANLDDEPPCATHGTVPQRR